MSSELQRARHINVKNHGTSFKRNFRTGVKQDEWIQTGKVQSVLMREDVITRAAERAERGLDQHGSVVDTRGTLPDEES